MAFSGYITLVTDVHRSGKGSGVGNISKPAGAVQKIWSSHGNVRMERTMNTVKLNYQDFMKELQEILRELIPGDVQLNIHPVLKNNSLHLDGLVLYRNGSTMTPNFYLQEYYERYTAGESVHSLAEDIVTRWENSGQMSQMRIPDMDFEACRDYIVYRLVSAGRNQELLEEIPHIPFFDLAVVFYFLVGQDQEGISSIRISNDFMECWGVNTRILMKWAGRNTPRIFPVRCNPISRMVEQMVFHTEQEVKSFQGFPSGEPYVLTNNNGINGASVWLYPRLLKELACYFGGSFYILPSSIHELLIVADDGQFPEADMLHMVAEVNRECVLPEEILSDHIYHYDREKGAVRMIEDVL